MTWQVGYRSGVLLTFVVVSAVTAGCGRESPDVNRVDAVALTALAPTGNATTEGAGVTVNPVAPSKSKLPPLGEMLGVTVPYLEAKLGPAKYVERDDGVEQRTYQIEGCTVEAYLNGDSVGSVELPDARPGCTIEMSEIFGKENLGNVLSGPTRSGVHEYSFGELLEFASEWTADESCLQGCGNAVEPTYGVKVELPRVYQGMEMHLQVSYTDASGEASDRLRESLFAQYPTLDPDAGDLWGEYVQKIGQDSYNTAWLAAFRDVKVESVRVGYGIFE